MILVFSLPFEAKQQQQQKKLKSFLCFLLTIPTAAVATRTVATARALEPRPRSWTTMKAPRGTASSA